MKYRKKSSLIEATQWFQNGDHPQDESEPIANSGESMKFSEGKVVQHYRSEETVPGMDSPVNLFCPQCGNRMLKHGLLDGANGEETVCPGDYVVTDRNGLYYRVSRGEFESQYERWAPPPRPNRPPLSDLEERQRHRRSERP